MFQLVMFMDRVYHFSDGNEKVYFWDVNKLGKLTISDVYEQGYHYQLVMLMDRVYHFSDVNEKGNCLNNSLKSC